MRRRYYTVIVLFAFLICFISHANAAKLRGDTVSVARETNIYINVPGNGVLAEGGDVWQNSMVIDFFVEPNGNGDPIPDWKPLKHISGQELNLVRSHGHFNPKREYYYRWQLASLPENVGDSVYEISCTVGEQTLTATMTIHCVEIELPTGLRLVNLDDEVRADNRTSIDFWPEITPEGWQVPGYPQLRWGFDDEADRFATVVPVKNDLSPNPYIDINDRHKLTFWRSGEYDSTYIITSDTISVGRLVHFIIEPVWTFSFPEDIKTIGENSFEGTGAESIYIPDGCERIEEKAFADSKIVDIFIPASVTEIGENAIPEGTVIYTPEGSPTFIWASEAGYEVYARAE